MADDVKTSDEIELEAIEKAISKRSAAPSGRADPSGRASQAQARAA